MDIKNTIKNLHPLEIKVLLKYTGKDELTSEKLRKELDYKEGHANQASHGFPERICLKKSAELLTHILKLQIWAAQWLKQVPLKKE